MDDSLRSVTLEMSLKPFREGFSAGATDSVVREAFRQWDALTRHAEEVRVLLWTADGSEILEFTGDLDAEMEWACHIGGANRNHQSANDPERLSLHARSTTYCDDPPTLRYRDLQRIVGSIKMLGQAMTGKAILVGTIFDPGPEFARSRFKYEWHNEICLAHTMGANSFVCCYASLAGDERPYAAYPDGIPDGLPFGAFFGAQCRHFLPAMGFDYLWLSNGFGYGLETWRLTGSTFDGTRFLPEERGRCGELNLGFWRALRAEIPDVPIEVRGTNLTTGLDVGGDGVPLRDIYEGGFGLPAPPNSPWAALNHDFGMELAGWMSHVAELPSDNGAFPFRFYIHDPWWKNSPWLDRYGREAHDIHLPGAISRIDAEGCCHIPDRIELLSIDDSFGEMPVRVPNEVIPHLLDARRSAPDEAGPLVWVYPWDEIHDAAFGPAGELAKAWIDDWCIRTAINEGLPLNTVISTRSAISLMQADARALRGRILLLPVPTAGSGIEAAVLAWLAHGEKALLYGSTRRAGPALLQALGLAHAAERSGAMNLSLFVDDDPCLRGSMPARIDHPLVLNDGGLIETAEVAKPVASVGSGADERVLATAHDGALWVRGGNMLRRIEGYRRQESDPALFARQERLLRLALAEAGWSIRCRRRHPAQPGHICTIHRSDNGWVFAGLARRTTASLLVRTQEGVPLFIDHDTCIEDGHALYDLPRSWRRECRVFVDQHEGVDLSCREANHNTRDWSRCLHVDGLKDATVTVYPGRGRTCIASNNSPSPYIGGGDPLDETVHDDGGRIVYRHVSGLLVLRW